MKLTRWKYLNEKPIERHLRFHQVFVDRDATMEHMFLDPGLWTYDNFMEEKYGFRLYTKKNWWKREKDILVITKHHPLWKEKEDDSIIH